METTLVMHCVSPRLVGHLTALCHLDGYDNVVTHMA